MIGSCGKCDFSFSIDRDLVCRRYPPTASVVVLPRQTLQGVQMQPQPITSWPMVRLEDVCAEWRPTIALAS